MRLEATAFGAATGLTLGLGGFLATLFSLWWGGGNTITLLAAIYAGYSWSFVGALLALVWGLIYGFIVGGFFAMIYNFLASRSAARRRPA